MADGSNQADRYQQNERKHHGVFGDTVASDLDINGVDQGIATCICFEWTLSLFLELTAVAT